MPTDVVTVFDEVASSTQTFATSFFAADGMWVFILAIGGLVAVVGAIMFLLRMIGIRIRR